MTPANFDRVASLYRWAEYATFGRQLEHTRLGLLEALPPARQALLLGDGDGRFLARLLAKQPELRSTAVDTSARMLQLLGNRCAHLDAARPALVHASALDLGLLPRDTDLLVSHFFLDCFTQSEVEFLIASITPQVAPEAVWLISDFAVPPSRWLRPFATLLIAALYLAFRWTTGLSATRLPAIEPAMRRNGWTRTHRTVRMRGLLFTELWSRL